MLKNTSAGIKSFPLNHNINDMFRSCLIVSKHNNAVRTDNFQVSLSSVVARKGIEQKLTIFKLTCTGHLSLLLFKQASQRVIFPMILWKRLYSKIGIILAFEDILDKNKQHQRMWKVISIV